MTHGTRTAYTYHRCRCTSCREASREYSIRRREQNPGPNPLVSSDKAAAHLRILRRSGVGWRSVRDVTGISVSHLRRIEAGSMRITLRTEGLILGVTPEAYSGGARVPAGPTVEIVRKLKRSGFNYEQLALRLDCCPETLQKMVKRKRNITATTQMKVQRFYNRFTAEAA